MLDPDHGLNYVIFVNGIQGGGFNYPTLTPVATEINLGHAPGTAALRGSVSEILFFTQSLNTINSTYGVTWKDKVYKPRHHLTVPCFQTTLLNIS